MKPHTDESMAPAEFSRLQRITEIAAGGLVCEVVASPAECAAVAVRLGVAGLAKLTCRFDLANAEGGVIVAQGRLVARVTRECVVSLDLFEAAVAERFGVRFVPHAKLDGDAFVDPDSDDEIPYSGVLIDLGEAATEQLALALDPYPRKPGAVLEAPADPAPTPLTPGFAALARRVRSD